MFTTILYGFGMICMELTRTDAVFSRTTVILFFVQKWKFPKWAETFWQFFLEKRDPRSFMGGPEEPRGGHNPPGRAWGARLAPVGYAHLKAHLRVISTLKNPINRETIRNNSRSEVPLPQASVATRNQSRPCSGTLPEGEIITGGHLHHPDAFHDKEGVVHPRGWGYVPVAMCLISLSISCSLSCSLYGTILMYPKLCYYSWILWRFSPSLLSCDELSFPFEVILSDWVFNDLRTLDVCLAMLICGDNGISCATWCMFWWQTCGFRPWTYA